MIHPSELRLNNAVIMPNESIGVVKGIDEEQIIVTNEETWYTLHPDQLRPVIITHELLEKCGFRLELESPLVNEDGSIQPPEGFIWKDKIKLYLRGDEVYMTTHYTSHFHKLQNLYFFSTGTELAFAR